MMHFQKHCNIGEKKKKKKKKKKAEEILEQWKKGKTKYNKKTRKPNSRAEN